MEEATSILVLKITMVNGEVKRHSYSGCPSTKDTFGKWWREMMESIFSEKGLRPWVKLRNPTALYNTQNITIWEFECSDNEEVLACVDDETDLMLRLVCPDRLNHHHEVILRMPQDVFDQHTTFNRLGTSPSRYAPSTSRPYIVKPSASHSCGR